MRLYHPTTLMIFANRKDIPKRFSCTPWSEIFKWKASGKSHPKMFIDDNAALGQYLYTVYCLAKHKGCKLNPNLVEKLGKDVLTDFEYCCSLGYQYRRFNMFFDNDYLFSDACSLYFKGINIFPDIYGDRWRKYVPVESLEEIKRQLDKTLSQSC